MRKNPVFPKSVTISTLYVLFVLLWNVIRLYSALVNWQILNEFGADPVYILVTALIWTTTGIFLIYAVWQRYPYTARAMQVSAVLYYAWYWIDRVFVQQSPSPDVIFSIIISTILLIIFCGILCSPAVKGFIKEE